MRAITPSRCHRYVTHRWCRVYLGVPFPRHTPLPPPLLFGLLPRRRGWPPPPGCRGVGWRSGCSPVGFSHTAGVRFLFRVADWEVEAHLDLYSDQFSERWLWGERLFIWGERSTGCLDLNLPFSRNKYRYFLSPPLGAPCFSAKPTWRLDVHPSHHLLLNTEPWLGPKLRIWCHKSHIQSSWNNPAITLDVMCIPE